MATFDLPIEEVTILFEDYLASMGQSVTVDGVSIKIMSSDIQNPYNYKEENMKQLAISKKVVVHRGSKVIFADGRVGIVNSIPTDDMVGLSVTALMCNSKITLMVYGEVYDENNGDLLSKGYTPSIEYDGFVERISGSEKQFDFGKVHQSRLIFITFSNCTVKLGDVVKLGVDYYKCVDVNTAIEGLVELTVDSVAL